jgi:choline transport protein
MAELVSMWPTAGGQYHWTYMLAPESWKTVLSYVTGWYVCSPSTVLG